MGSDCCESSHRIARPLKVIVAEQEQTSYGELVSKVRVPGFTVLLCHLYKIFLPTGMSLAMGDIFLQ